MPARRRPGVTRRANEEIIPIKTDPHSPSAIRGTVPETNQTAFYEAFDVKEGDKMYLRDSCT